MRIIILGPQGSGKSTQAKLLAAKLAVPYIEMGQLLRDKMQGNRQEAGEIRQALEVGDLVPDQITVKILHERLFKKDCQRGYVLDGYPRNYAQLEGLPKDIDKILNIEIPDQEAIARLIKRGRHDDRLDTIARRLDLYHKETKPLLTYFRQEGILEEVDGHATIDKIHQEIVEKVNKMSLIKKNQEIELMRISGNICARALKEVLEHVRVGAKCIDLDKIARNEIEKRQASPSFMTVDDYKWTICTTINDQVVHGIPASIKLAAGDIIGIDIGALYKGYHSDMAISVPVGETSGGQKKFLQVGRDTLEIAISQAKVGNTIGDISANIQEKIEGAGYSVVKSLTGHGIGRNLHEDPMVPGFGQKGTGLAIRQGMTLAIEVIYAQGSSEVKLEPDGWTISTVDGSLGGLFEQTIAVTKDGPIVLTPYL